MRVIVFYELSIFVIICYKKFIFVAFSDKNTVKFTALNKQKKCGK